MSAPLILPAAGPLLPRAARPSLLARAAAALFNRRTGRLWALFIASRVCVLLFLAGRGSDLYVHAGYGLAIRHGQVPFRDFLPEYPPLALAFDAIPAVLDPTGAHYDALFRFLCVGVDLLIWSAMLVGTRPRWQPCVLYVVCSTALGHLLYDRLDLTLGGIGLLVLFALNRQRVALAAVATGSGIAFKLLPVIWVPLIFSAAWRRHRWNGLIESAAWLAVPIVIAFGPLYLLGADRLDYLFAYHLRRGVQVESVPATLGMIVAAATGQPARVAFDHGSYNLYTAGVRGIGTAAAAVGGCWLAVLFTAEWFGKSRRPLGHDRALLASLLVLFSCGKVLSPQYLLIALPLCCVVIGHVVHAGTWFAGAVVCSCLTGALYPFVYGDLLNLGWESCSMLEVRNTVLMAGAISSSRDLIETVRMLPSATARGVAR